MKISIPIIEGKSSIAPSSLALQLIKSAVEAVAWLSLLSWLKYVETVSKLGLLPDLVLLLSASNKVLFSLFWNSVTEFDLWPKKTFINENWVSLICIHLIYLPKIFKLFKICLARLAGVESFVDLDFPLVFFLLLFFLLASVWFKIALLPITLVPWPCWPFELFEVLQELRPLEHLRPTKKYLVIIYIKALLTDWCISF